MAHKSLLQLAGQGALVGQKGVFGQLLRDGAAALGRSLRRPAAAHVGDKPPAGRPHVDAVVFVEAVSSMATTASLKCRGICSRRDGDAVFPVNEVMRRP